MSKAQRTLINAINTHLIPILREKGFYGVLNEPREEDDDSLLSLFVRTRPEGYVDFLTLQMEKYQRPWFRMIIGQCPLKAINLPLIENERPRRGAIPAEYMNRLLYLKSGHRWDWFKIPSRLKFWIKDRNEQLMDYVAKKLQDADRYWLTGDRDDSIRELDIGNILKERI